ncbi:uncharacterized protein LOC110686379 isoform X1 [Chenopodium quinoa]|uniref:uncharacterized protein LOC110686379 isoform X1 n=1 Tax=Chenopodium quinoa TaxID=63459 RepID=UPI000B78215E|nr:uncharacterized protein LOC110686379 isoform X1 [Chenopodium quinoa]
MEENPECNCCSSWEEEMYWKHFNSVHFCLTLASDFHDHLVLPGKFAAHMNDLPDKVSLKGPSGALWEIELLKSDDLLFVGNGWKDFVKVNDLNENCILVFNYKRSSNFEVLIFDERSSCEKESAYFVKKRRHTESNLEDQKKRTASEASSDKIEDNDDEGPAFVVTKKSKKDGEEVVRSREKLNAPISKKRVLCAATRPKGRLRRVVPPLNPPSDKNIKSGKSIRNENLKEPNQISNQDRIASENGGILPEKDHSQKVLTKSKKKSKGKGTVDELTQNAKDLTTPENGKNSLAADHSHILKAHSENPVHKNVTAIDPSQTKVKYLFTMENGDGFRVTDHSYSEKAPSENRLSRNDTSKDRSQTLQEELITPENSEISPVADCSPDFEGQAELAEKEPNGSSIAKDAIPISVWGPLVTSDYRESSPEKDHSCKSLGKRGQPKKQVPKSSKKSGLKRGVKGFSKEYISNRRPVTEEEKNDALRRANQKQTENSFTAIMRPTCVYKRFFLQIPAEWQFKNLFHHKQEVILRVGENSWHASIVNYGCKNRGISTGWKKFALENFLEEFDVLVFQLGSQKDEAVVVIDVDIFRVIPSTVPPHPISS